MVRPGGRRSLNEPPDIPRPVQNALDPNRVELRQRTEQDQISTTHDRTDAGCQVFAPSL